MYNMGIIKNITFVLSILMFITGIATMIYGQVKYGNEEKIVKCYDRFSNEIIGQECYELKSKEYLGMGALAIFGGFMFRVISMLEGMFE